MYNENRQSIVGQLCIVSLQMIGSIIQIVTKMFPAAYCDKVNKKLSYR